jgi:ribosomal protein S18 acetylase RimI-like enzyme
MYDGSPMNEGLTIVRGMSPGALDDAVDLLLEAFALKLEHDLRPKTPEQAHRLIAEGIAPELGWVALDERGALLGVAGVGVYGRRFSQIQLRTFLREFGLMGAISRWLPVFMEEVMTRPGQQQWRLEVLAVTGTSRGSGVGSRLLGEVLAAAREAGVRSVGLEVVDTNVRAMQLYERIGFRWVLSIPTAWLTESSGYRAIHFMRFDVSEMSEGSA